jgi:3-oxoacyl-[acyl-carrier protein] reductase
MDLGLKNKTALVLGAGGGLGSAIARTVAREGANIALADIAKDSLDRTKAAIEPSGVKCLALEWDISDLALIEPRIAAIEAELGPVDVLVNNTGGPPPTPASGQDHLRLHWILVLLCSDHKFAGATFECL